MELSTIIDLVNERFGTSWSKADGLLLEQTNLDAADDPDLQQASMVNALDTWKFLYDRKFEDLLVDRLQRNPEIATWVLSDPERLKMIRNLYAPEVYDACRKAAGSQS